MRKFKGLGTGEKQALEKAKAFATELGSEKRSLGPVTEYTPEVPMLVKDVVLDFAQIKMDEMRTGEDWGGVIPDFTSGTGSDGFLESSPVAAILCARVCE